MSFNVRAERQPPRAERPSNPTTGASRRSRSGNRCTALTVFCYGNWGWDDFDLGPEGNLRMMRSRALEAWV